MPGDYSRFTFDPKKFFTRVLKQQGRVELDSDWNELVEILTRSDRLRTLDVIGPAAVPMVGARGAARQHGAFEITAVSNDDFSITAGRMYVDGLMVESFNDTFYKNQPFFIDGPPPLKRGRGLLYIDVWEREVDALVDPDLLEPALGGIDTTTRTKLVWQVKFEPGLGCDSDLRSYFQPSDVRMSVTLDPKVEDPDPCRVPDAGQFVDVENRLYCVKLHERRDTAGASTGFFVKFFRDPIFAEVTKVEVVGNQSTLTVNRLGRDAILRFSKEDDPCVEYVTEKDLLNGVGGVIARVVDIKEASRQIVIDQPLDAIGDSDADKARRKTLRPRLIAWHQKTDPASDSMIPFKTGQPIPLERGISVAFSGTRWHHGDYWLFPARAAQHTAGPVENELPRGVGHHYAPLATVTLGAEASRRESDCRTIWPPECGCDCTECVNPDDHNAGIETIQMAIDAVLGGKAASGEGGEVCLAPGTYYLDKPVVIQGRGLRLTGHGEAILLYSGAEPQAILLDSCCDVTLENLIVVNVTAAAQHDVTAITVSSCMRNVTIQDCIVLTLVWTMAGTAKAAETSAMRSEKAIIFAFGQPGVSQARAIAIGLDNVIYDVQIAGCILLSDFGVASLISNYLYIDDLDIHDNVIAAGSTGIDLGGGNLALCVSRNEIETRASGGVGVRLSGTTTSSNTVDGNTIACPYGAGIELWTDNTTISNNTITGMFAPDGKGGPAVATASSGIVLRSARVSFAGGPKTTNNDDLDTVDGFSIIGNRLRSLSGMGILVEGPANGMIKQNMISQTAGGGIVFVDAAMGSKVAIDNNELRRVGLGSVPSTEWPICGIRLPPDCDAGVIGNTIDGVGTSQLGLTNPAAAGIHAPLPHVARIQGNRVVGVAASQTISAAIHVEPPIGAVVIENNMVYVESALHDSARIHCEALRLQARLQPGWTILPIAQPWTASKESPKAMTTAQTALNYQNIVVWTDFPEFTPVVQSPSAIIRGNQLESVGGYTAADALVRIDDTYNRCTFGGNVCSVTLSGGGYLGIGALMNVWSAIVDSNQILGMGTDHVAIQISTSSKGDPPLWTVLGNIVFGSIIINDDNWKSTSTSNPFRPLNRMF